MKTPPPRHNLTFALALALGPSLFGCVEPEDDLAAAEQEIINGTAVDASTIKNLGLADIGTGCSGVLYRNDWVLTAGHCVAGQNLTSVNYDGTVRVSDRILRFGGYNDWKGPDLALVHVPAPFVVNGSTTGFSRAIHLSSADGLRGLEIDLFGRGYNTVAGAGFGIWRTGRVAVDAASGDLLAFKPNSLGQVIWPGDSGGPSFYGNALVGIHSGVSWTCAGNSPPGQCWNQTPTEGRDTFLAPLMFGMNTAMDRLWDVTRATDHFDVSGHEIRAARQVETDLNVGAWAVQRRVASELCENRGFTGGHYDGHQLNGLYGLTCSGAGATGYDATPTEINATGWSFYDVNTVGWGQAARAANEVCKAKGHLSGFFTGFEVLGSAYGLICVGGESASHFDASWSELQATGFRVDDVNTTAWAQAQRAANNYCASRGWETGFMNGHQQNGYYGVTCQRARGANTLAANQLLAVDVPLRSPNRRYELVLQTDGNLVIYANGAPARRALWATGTSGYAGARAIMQTDGNLVIYDAANRPLWSSATYGHPGAYLSMQDDGNLVIYAPGAAMTALWASYTVQP